MLFSKKDIRQIRDAFCRFDNISAGDDLRRLLTHGFNMDYVAVDGPPGSGKSKILYALAFGYAFKKITPAPRFLTLTVHPTEGTELYTKVKRAVDFNNVQNIVKRMSLASLKKIKLTADDFLMVDEASLISEKDMLDLLLRVKEAGCKVALVGDIYQITPARFHSGFKDIPKTILFTKIFRQRHSDHAKASVYLRQGQIKKALAIYAKENRFHFFDDSKGLFNRLKKDFKANPSDEKIKAVLTPSSAEKKLIEAQKLPAKIAADIQGSAQDNAFVVFLKRRPISLPVLLVLLTRHRYQLNIYVAKSAFSDINDLCKNIHTAC